MSDPPSYTGRLAECLAHDKHHLDGCVFCVCAEDRVGHRKGQGRSELRVWG